MVAPTTCFPSAPSHRPHAPPHRLPTLRVVPSCIPSSQTQLSRPALPLPHVGRRSALCSLCGGTQLEVFAECSRSTRPSVRYVFPAFDFGCIAHLPAERPPCHIVLVSAAPPRRRPAAAPRPFSPLDQTRRWHHRPDVRVSRFSTLFPAHCLTNRVRLLHTSCSIRSRDARSVQEPRPLCTRAHITKL